MLVDSWYDPYLGVVVMIRIVDGVVRKGDRIVCGLLYLLTQWSVRGGCAPLALAVSRHLQLLAEHPDSPELLYDHALAAEKVDRIDVLEKNLRRLIELQPDHAHAYNALGYSFADRNTRLPEARKLIERALELLPEDYYIIDSMGWVLYRMGDLKGALGYLRRAYDGRPDAEIGAHLGEVLWKLGEREEAERVWRDVLERDPENETLQRTLKRLRP